MQAKNTNKYCRLPNINILTKLRSVLILPILTKMFYYLSKTITYTFAFHLELISFFVVNKFKMKNNIQTI